MGGIARQAFVAAGANLGDREATLLAAIACLRSHRGIEHLEHSSLYETEPVGIVDQPRFLNLAIGLETTLSPEEMLGALQEIEQRFGRVRVERWGPRTLDLDLLVFEGETRASEALQLPHPRMLERPFVLAPLRELLARARFQRPCWAALRNALTPQTSTEGVKLFRS